MPPAERARPTADDYPYHVPITTRWMDNDVYGHVNNVAYYSYFDSAANLFLIREGGLDIHAADSIALVVASRCAYHAAIAYPVDIFAGVRVERLGRRSVTWGIAIFAADEPLASAHGEFVHVFVDRVTRKPVGIPDHLRAALATIAMAGASGDGSAA